MSDARLPDSWHVEQLRMTSIWARKGASVVRDAGEFFVSVLGEPPQNESIQRRGPEPLVAAESPYGDGYVTLRHQANRYDWLLSAVPQLDPPGGLLAFGQFRQAIEAMETLLQAGAMEASRPATRIAFGGVLLHPVPTLEEGYEFLNKMLPGVEVDPAGSQDFMYRINRRRDAGSADVPINRLCEWSVAQVLEQEILLGPSASIQDGDVTFLARLRLDINTAPEFEGDFSGDIKLRLFRELMALGEELATSGDVP